MANERRGFYWKISSTNVLPDGMLKPVSYTDFALISALKNKPPELKNNYFGTKHS